MRSPPIQIAAALEQLRMSMTVGNMKAMSRPAFSEVSVRSSLAPPKRAVSFGSRTKARTTRRPVICSRSTSLMRSMRSCIRWNCGSIRMITRPTLMMRAGTLTSSSSESGPSSRTAMIEPPMIVIGAATKSVQIMTTRVCTWVTSLVMRVISEAEPNVATSWVEKPVTWWKSALRTSRPKAIAARAPK